MRVIITISETGFDGSNTWDSMDDEAAAGTAADAGRRKIGNKNSKFSS
jgi:hypothetical protein